MKQLITSTFHEMKILYVVKIYIKYQINMSNKKILLQ